MSEKSEPGMVLNLTNQINDLKVQVAEISTDIKWMRTSIEVLNEKLGQCAVCRSAPTLIKDMEKNTSDILVLHDEVNAAKNKAIGISAGVSFFVITVGLILKFVV